LGPALRWMAGAFFLVRGYSEIELAQCVYTLPSTHIDAFAIGAFLSVANRHRLPNPKAAFCLILGLLFLLGFFQWGVLDPHSRSVSDFGYPIYLSVRDQYLWGYTIVNLLGGAMVLWAVTKTDSPPKWDNGFLRFYGRISYALYVVHWPMLGVLRRVVSYEPWSPKGMILFVVFFLAATFLSWWSYRYYERRFLRLKDRYPF